MKFTELLRPPRHLLALFFAIVATLAGALGWLSWRLIEQDRALETQRQRERLDGAAELITTALQARLSEIESEIRAMAALPDVDLAAVAARSANKWQDAVLVVLRPGSVEAYPPSGLLYYPVVAASKEISPGVFREAEVLEFRKNDSAGAISLLRAQTRSEDPWIRGSAWLRIARNFRKMEKPQEALDAYAELGKIQSVSFGGVPAGLVARHARCAILEESRRVEDLEREAQMLRADLQQGRWVLTRGTFQFYSNEVGRWAKVGQASSLSNQSEALASGVEALWEEWQTLRQRDGDLSGRFSSPIDDNPVVVFYEGTPQRAVSLVATRSHAEQRFFAPLRPLLQRQGVAFSLLDNRRDQQAHKTGPSPRLVDAKLGWTVQVADAGGISPAAGSRRGLLVVGLALMAILIGAGTYFIARSVARELEVARLQSDFVAAVSHEFRTPLSSLRQLSELLADGRVPSPERRQVYYENLRRESERLHRLVEDILDFGRMEAGARQYRFDLVNPSKLIEELSREFTEEVRQSGYLVDVQSQPDLPLVRADKEAFGRAIWNLLDNAVKYSPECKQIWIETKAKNGWVTIRVRDRGVGISDAEQGRIFEKFVRGENVRAAGIKGTGLGLAMVKRIVVEHDGEIDVESRPGAGSIFTIRIPALKEPA